MLRPPISYPATSATRPAPEESPTAQSSPTLWTSLDPQHQLQLTQHLAELLRRIRRPAAPALKGGPDEQH
jgi:hypothetical protein